jgi:hypothetical protein
MYPYENYQVEFFMNLAFQSTSSGHNNGYPDMIPLAAVDVPPLNLMRVKTEYLNGLISLKRPSIM